MYALRTRIKKDIVCEFLLPKKKTSKVIILAGGAPGYPERTELLFSLAKKGYAVFNPRYRGSWESGGSFLKVSPHKDILDIVDVLQSGFTDIVSGVLYAISKKDWKKLFNGRFYNPVAYSSKLDAKKIFLIHGENDRIVSVDPVALFATSVGCRIEILKGREHLSISDIADPAIGRKVFRFLNS
ncbi:MAG: hypothetical protein WDZ88_00405 [Candidatus Paceibacterota bacterium]